jgi:hypothetical protein
MELVFVGKEPKPPEKQNPTNLKGLMPIRNSTIPPREAYPEDESFTLLLAILPNGIAKPVLAWILRISWAFSCDKTPTVKRVNNHLFIEQSYTYSMMYKNKQKMNKHLVFTVYLSHKKLLLWQLIPAIKPQHLPCTIQKNSQ